MFTGLVEGLGRIVALKDEGPGKRLSIDVGALADGVQLGDSISISGCCLTVVRVDQAVLEFEAGSETLSRTILGRLVVGSHVNLERSLRVGDRMGGHFVTGHVDAVGWVDSREDDEKWSTIYFGFPDSLAPEIAAKGSVTVSGVSLTVVAAEARRFSVALIPHTLEVTTLGSLKLGDPVNLETDVLAKYVRRAFGEVPGR